MSKNIDLKQNQKLKMVQELRAKNENDDAGIIEGYAAVWDTIDSYNSRFQRGCFKKTLENRTHKIRVLYNHDIEQPIGKMIDIYEDDHGLFVRAQLNMNVQKGKETFYLIKDGNIDCFSFGFRTIKDKYVNGVQVITEVALGEVSPVVFEANPASQIVGVRSTDFNQTDKAADLEFSKWRLLESLQLTLEDIFFEREGDKVKMINDAIEDFKGAYVGVAEQLFQSDDLMRNIGRNDLAKEFRNYCLDNNKTIEVIAMETSLTIPELRSLKLGKTIENKYKLSELNANIEKTHEKERCKAVETLCDELRAGISEAEATRLNGLLNKSLQKEIETDSSNDNFEVDILNMLNDFNSSLKV